MKPAEFHGSIAFAEAEATKFGLEIAEQAGCLPLIVETDSQEVVDLVLNRKGARKEIFWLISEIQAILSRMQQSKFQHILRSGNSAAHSLAKLALKQDTVISWLENIPESILSVITDFEK